MLPSRACSHACTILAGERSRRCRNSQSSVAGGGTRISGAWAELTRPLGQSRLGLVATGGIYALGQTAFTHRDDTSYRTIPVDADPADLRVTHSLCQTCAREHYPEFTRCHDEEEPAKH